MKILIFSGLLVFLSNLSVAQATPSVLKPQKPESSAPRFSSVQPVPFSEDHFVARTKHLLELVRKHPAPKNNLLFEINGIQYDPLFKIKGVEFWPSTPITRDALKLIDKEPGEFNSEERDQILKCGYPTELPSDTQVLLLDVVESHLAVPVFLTPDGMELHYIELSLDHPSAPLLLVITGYDALAVRITTSPATHLAAVHLQTYYPNVVLGVESKKVTQQYYRGASDNNCQYISDTPIIEQLGFDLNKTTRYKTKGQSQIAIGKTQRVKRSPPTLGNFLDPEMPIPNNYGIMVLANLGYIQPVTINPSSGDSGMLNREAFKVLKPFQIPAGLAGGHSVTFLLTPDSPIPSGNLEHSSMVQQIR